MAGDEATLQAGRRVIAVERAALAALEESLDAAFAAAVETLQRATGRVVCAGVGKSGHVARKMSATLASTGTPSFFLHPTEASHGDLGMVTAGDVVVALSKSGETRELSDLIAYARRFAMPLVAITAVADSTLARAADIALLVPDAPEACSETSAPTTSTTLMMALGDALAVAVLERRGFTATDFRIYHPGGKLGAMLTRVKDLMHTGEALPLVDAQTGLDAALQVMSEKGLGCLGVTGADSRLAGIITDGDVRRLVVSGRAARTAGDLMTPSPVTVSPGELASAALALMNVKRITQLLVTEDGRPVGLLHMHDFLKAGVA